MRANAKTMLAQGPVEGKWDLPVGWEWKRLGEVASTSSGGTPSRKLPDFFQGTIPWVKSGELNDSVVNEVEESITQQALNSSSAKIFPKGTLCIALYGATVGKLGFLGVDAATNQAVCAIFSPRLYSLFLFYYLLMQRQSLIDLGQGGAQPNISQTILSEFPVPLPPTIQDQERIVERIDSLFAELDKAEETLRHTITLCEQYKQSVLKAAVTGELSKEWRKANPPKETGEQLLQRILKERRAAWEKAELAKLTAKGQKPANDNWKKKYKEPQAPDTSGLPELPEGWTWASMDMLADVKGGITVDKKKVYDISVPYLRVANVQEGFLDLSEIKKITASQEIIENLRLEKGDILLNEGGDRDKLGRGWVWNNELPLCIHQNHVFRARLLVKDFISEFFSIYTNTFGKQFFFDEGKQTTNLASISMTKLKSIPIPIPPVGEQGYIFNSINQHIDENNIAFDFCNKNLVQTAALRQSILKQAFTGQLL